MGREPKARFMTVTTGKAIMPSVNEGGPKGVLRMFWLVSGEDPASDRRVTERES
jgi:hypothetical protein